VELVLVPLSPSWLQQCSVLVPLLPLGLTLLHFLSLSLALVLSPVACLSAVLRSPPALVHLAVEPKVLVVAMVLGLDLPALASKQLVLVRPATAPKALDSCLSEP